MSLPPVVLHVEDDPNDRLLLSIVFKKVADGAILRTADDGQEAVDYLSGQGAYADRVEHPLPQVVLLDLKMPRMSGFEVLAWAKERPALERMPILVLTSSQEQSDIYRAYDLGAHSYLVKSVDLGHMREIVQGVVALARLLSGAA